MLLMGHDEVSPQHACMSGPGHCRSLCFSSSSVHFMLLSLWRCVASWILPVVNAQSRHQAANVQKDLHNIARLLVTRGRGPMNIVEVWASDGGAIRVTWRNPRILKKS